MSYYIELHCHGEKNQVFTNDIVNWLMAAMIILGPELRASKSASTSGHLSLNKCKSLDENFCWRVNDAWVASPAAWQCSNQFFFGSALVSYAPFSQNREER